jgi:hypothetical protein
MSPAMLKQASHACSGQPGPKHNAQKLKDYTAGGAREDEY